MKINKMFQDGDAIILVTYLIGVVVIGFGVHIGTKKKEAKSKQEYENKIDDLGDTISKQQYELDAKQDSIQELTQKVLSFSKRIDINTGSIEKLARGIDKVTMNTNSISRNINNELKEKGEFKINVPNAERFDFGIGSNFMSVQRQTLEQGYNLNVAGFSMNLYLKLKDDQLFLSTIIFDKHGDVLVEIVDNEWALTKSKTFSINYDNKGLEVINSSGLVIFQLNIVESNINIQMINFSSTGVKVIADYGTKSRSYNNPGSVSSLLNEAFMKIKPIFKHYGEGYLGKRIYKRRTNRESKL